MRRPASRAVCVNRTLEHRLHSAGIGLVNERLDLVAAQGLCQSLDGGVALPALLDGQHIDISGAGGALGGLNRQGVGYLQIGLDGVVAVDDGNVQAAQGAGSWAASISTIS